LATNGGGRGVIVQCTIGAPPLVSAGGNDDQCDGGLRNCGRWHVADLLRADDPRGEHPAKTPTSGDNSTDGGNYSGGDGWTLASWFGGDHSPTDGSGNPSDFGGGDSGGGGDGGGGDGGGGGGD
jgi:hypothetical protein